METLPSRSPTGRRGAEEARCGDVAEADDSQSRVTLFDPAMMNLLVVNNAKHERIVPDGPGTTWGGQTQIVQASKRSSSLGLDHRSPLASQRVT